MDIRIRRFIEAQHVFSLCTSLLNEPHCASCMYVFFSEQNSIIFCSENHTRHVVNARVNKKVAGTILPSRMKTGIVQGIQFTGTFSSVSEDSMDLVKRLYYRKYPFALAMSGQLWQVSLETIKMTDNTFGLQKKIFWELNAQPEL